MPQAANPPAPALDQSRRSHVWPRQLRRLRLSLAGSLAVPLVGAAMGGILRLTSVAPPFLKGAFDVMFGDETIDCFNDRNRHRDGRDQIIAVVGQGLALRGVGGHGQDIELTAYRIPEPRRHAPPTRLCHP